MDLLASVSRAVEVLHDRGSSENPRWTVGSGYLVGPRRVLTAAHNVNYRLAPGTDEQLLIRRVDGREYAARVTHVGAQGGPDLAIVEVTDPGFESEDNTPVEFARVDRSSLKQLLDCWVVGFPRFKEKQRDKPRRGIDTEPALSLPPRLRDSAHLLGHVPPAANLVSGLLELHVTASPATSEGDQLARSPWAGMSGAVVFSGDHTPLAIGVVTEHHQPEGPAALTLVPITALESLDAEEGARWWHELGVAEPSDLISIPRPAPSLAYLDRITAIALRTPILRDREEWIADLSAFATSSEGYRWLVGVPRAGKTALAAHLLGRCPPSVDWVGYFLTRRLSDADSGRLATVVSKQLARLLGEEAPYPPDDPDEFVGLWRRAVERAERQDRHLLLVVDGLDEDLSHSLGRPSVAALLPTLVGGSAHVLVTGRRSPGLPADVADDHPLHRLEPIELLPTPHAFRAAASADQELKLLLERSDELSFDCISLLTAAEGALSVSDVIELSRELGHAPRRYKIGGILGRELARVLEPINDASGLRYAFADDQLRLQGATTLQEELEDYRQHIHRWASHYRAAGWPPDTPGYLLDSYPNMLTRHQPKLLREILEDFGYLETAIVRMGVDQVASTIRTARNVDRGLTALGVCLDQQAHNLRPVDPIDQPGYVSRQLCLQSLRLDERRLVTQALELLAALPAPQWLPHWTSGRASRALVRAIPGGFGPVAMSTNGRRAVTGGGVWGKERDLRLWDLSAGRPTNSQLPGHTTWVTGVAISADGLTAVSGSSSDVGGVGELLLWNLRRDEPHSVRMNQGVQLPVRGLGISASGEWVIGGGGGWLATWDRGYAFYPMPLRGHTEWGIWTVAMSADGRRAISGGGSEVLLWELADGQPTSAYQLSGHTEVHSVAITANGERAISGGADGELYLWDLSGQNWTAQRLRGHTRVVGAVAISADGTCALSGSGRDLLLWDLSGKKPRSLLLPGHTRAVEAATIRADNLLAISTSAGEMLFWDLTGPLPPGRPPSFGPAGWVTAVALSATGEHAVTAGHDVYTNVGELLLWDMTGEQPTSRPARDSDLSDVGDVGAISANGDFAVINDRLWDLSAGQPGSLPGDAGGAVTASADGRSAVSHQDGQLLLWNLSNDPPTSRPLLGHTKPIDEVRICGDGTRMISVGHDDRWTGPSELLLWDMTGEQPTCQPLLGHTIHIHAVRMSANGTHAVSHGMSTEGPTELLLWDLSTEQPTSQPMLGHVHPIDRVQISANCTRAISCGGDGVNKQYELLLWDLLGDQPVCHPLLRHALEFGAMAISPDGAWAASGSAGELRLWDLASHISTPAAVDGVIKSIDIAQPSPNRLEMLTGEWAGAVTAWTVRIWHHPDDNDHATTTRGARPGEILAGDGDHSTAEVTGTRLTQIAYTAASPEESVQLGRRMAAQGDPFAAYKAYQHAVESGDATWAVIATTELGDYLAANGYLTSAAASYQQAMQTAGEDATTLRLRFNLAMVFCEQSKVTQAIGILEQLADDDDPEAMPRAATRLGELRVVSGDFDGAIAAYQQAIETEHIDSAPEAAFELGNLFTKLERLDDAVSAYKKAMIFIAQSNRRRPPLT